MNLLVNYAVAGQTTDKKKAYCKEILELDPLPEIIIGAWGIGNDIQNSLVGAFTPQMTIDNLKWMLDRFTAKNIICVVLLPPAPTVLSPDQTAYGQIVTDVLIEMRRRNPLIILSNDFVDSVNPNTGRGREELFVDDVHENHQQAILNGAQVASLLGPLIGATLDRRVVSRFDRRKGSPEGSGPNSATSSSSSRQLMVGCWPKTNGGPESATNFSSATVNGLVDNGVSSISFTGTNSKVDCSLALRLDDYGYDQIFSFSSDSDNGSITIEVKNIDSTPNKWGFAQFLEAGKTYDASCGLSIELVTTDGVAGYEHYIELEYPNPDGLTTYFARYSDNMRSADCFVGSRSGPPTQGTLTVDVVEDPCVFPAFTVPATPVSGRWVFSLQLKKGWCREYHALAADHPAAIHGRHLLALAETSAWRPVRPCASLYGLWRPN